MAHLRTRYLRKMILDALSWSPCTAVLGMRQTGKSTLLKQFAKQYATFDDESLPGKIGRERIHFLESGPFPQVLDEVQKYPPIFDLLKMAIDQKKTPGRYLITGSVRFYQKKDIRESLTGRQVSFPLYPLCLAELHDRIGPTFLESVIKHGDLRTLKSRTWLKPKDMTHYLLTGGMPGICFKREEKIRNHLWEQHLDTLLGRDLQFVLKTRAGVPILRQLLFHLASQQGKPANLSSLGREVEQSVPLIKRILTALEALFLIRNHGKSIYLEDPGLSTYCLGDLSLWRRPSLLGLLFHELRCQVAQLGDPRVSLTEYRTRGGAFVPFVVKLKKMTVAFTLDPTDNVSEKSIRSLRAFKSSSHTPCRLVAFHNGEQFFEGTGSVLCLPLNALG